MSLYFAFKTIIAQKRRFLLILAAVAVCFTLITVLSGFTRGVMEAIETKAARYFSGHVSVSGYVDGAPGMRDPSLVMEAIGAYAEGIEGMSPRTVYYRTDASLFFGGESIRQRRLIGVRFRDELHQFEKLQLREGSDIGALSDGSMGILISESAARLLKARLGDEVVIFLTTDSGQYSTGTFVVKGIFLESSLFAYVAYIDIEAMNSLLGREIGAATDIAVFCANGVDGNDMTERIRTGLSSRFDVLPRLESRSALPAAIATAGSGSRLAVLSLDSQLSQIKSFIDAIMIINYVMLAVLILITVIGIINTYRIIVYQRTREIGVLRAIGMRRSSVVASFMWESLILSATASFLGLIAGVAIMQAVSAVDLSSIPITSIFTEKGRLVPYLDPHMVFLNFAIITVSLLVASFGPAYKASRISPIEAMK